MYPGQRSWGKPDEALRSEAGLGKRGGRLLDQERTVTAGHVSPRKRASMVLALRALKCTVRVALGLLGAR